MLKIIKNKNSRGANKDNLKPAGVKSELKAPTDLLKAFAAKPKAKILWADLTPIARRDFISWVDGAKQPETRKRRVDRIPDMLMSGKRRPCCFAIVPMNLYKALDAAPSAKKKWKDLTPDERRNFVDWIDEVKESEARRDRVEKVCLTLASGKRHP